MLDFSQINKCLIMTTGRTGSDLLHGRLDDVKGVMTFCGKFEYHQFFNGADEKKDKEKLIDSFLERYNELFSYNYIEDIDTNIDKEKFRENFLKIDSTTSINRKTFLFHLYEAYYLTLNRDIKDIKVLVHHSHGIMETKNFLKDFPESKMLITIRDPRANLKSGLVNWFSFDPKTKHMSHIFTYLKRIREDLRFALRKKNKKLFVKLEEANKHETLAEITKFLQIDFDQNLHKVTFASKIWRGDKLSKIRSRDGTFEEKVIDNKWETFFTSKDKLLLNLLYIDYKKFNYNLVHLKWFQKLQIFLLIFFPLSFEKLTFKPKKADIKTKISNYKYFFFRIVYLLLVFFRLNIFIKHAISFNVLRKRAR